MTGTTQKIKMRNVKSPLKCDAEVTDFNPSEGYFTVRFNVDNLDTRTFWPYAPYDNDMDSKLVITERHKHKPVGTPEDNPRIEVWEVL